MLKSIMPCNTPKQTYNLARTFRHSQTNAENILWGYLRAHKVSNIHFRRQYAIGKYIVDFCAPRRKIIIELDGSQHLDSTCHDRERSTFFESKGYRVLRFWNNEVNDDLDGVIKAIEYELTDLKENT